MATRLQLRKGTTTEHNTFVGAEGELTYDTDKKQLRVHDGSTVGGKVVDDTTRDVTGQVSNATAYVAGKVKINNTLTSTATDAALTAAQGKKLNDQAIGVGQTWQDVTSSRVLGTTYTNTTPAPIMISFSGYTAAGVSVNATVSNLIVITSSCRDSGITNSITFIVPSGSTYAITGQGISKWMELR